MKKSTIKLIAMLLTVVLMLPNFAGAGALNENSNALSDEKLSQSIQVIEDIISDGRICNFGLYSSSFTAIKHMGIYDSNIGSLDKSVETLYAVEIILEEADDPNIIFLLKRWHDELVDYLGVGTPSLSAESDNSNDPYKDYWISSPSGRRMHGKIYTGYSTPDSYKKETDYPSAEKIGSESYRYNCHAFAWYMCGDISARDPLLCFDNYDGFFGNSNDACMVVRSSSQKPAVGDIVTYTLLFNGVPEPNGLLHSAIITEIPSNISNKTISQLTGSSLLSDIVVESKWGEYGLYSHNLPDCPYYDDNVGEWSYKLEFFSVRHRWTDTGTRYCCYYCGLPAF